MFTGLVNVFCLFRENAEENASGGRNFTNNTYTTLVVI